MRVVCAAFLTLLVSLAALPAGAAVKIQDVKSSSGVSAWLVEDHSIPIITIRFAFEGGSTQEPIGKEGMAGLMSGLFDEGAGDLDSEGFQIKLDDVGAEMSFSASRDNVAGTMRMLSENRDAAFDLLRLAVNAPRFDPPAIERIRAQLVARVASRARDPGYAADELWRSALFGTHPYARNDDGTADSLTSISQDDLKAFHRLLFARDRLKVAVVGDIDAPALAATLDTLFGQLPASTPLAEIPDVVPKLAQDVRYDYPLPETSIRLAYPGIKRDDPAFFAAYLMNHILGAGTFTSRLFDEVREKRGLTYGIQSGLISFDHADALIISTSTRPDKKDEMLTVIRDVVAGLAKDGPTAQELEAAKRYVTGAYAVNNLSSSMGIASTLVELQMQGLPIDYMDRRASLIDAVTIEQVRDAAKRLLSDRPALMIVGPAAKDESKG